MWSRRMSFAALLALSACSAESRVTVILDAQPGARAEGAELTVRVIGHDGSVRLEDVRAVGPSTGWPLRLPLVPEGGDAARTWVVEATLRNAEGEVIAVARSRGGYVEGASREASVCLFDGCAGTACGSTGACTDPSGACLTCRSGGCEDASAPLEASGSTPRCPVSDCVPTSSRERTCDDGIDDDCDGAADCADPDCGCDAGHCVPVGPENTLEACRNGIDDDCDGTKDCGESNGDCVFPEGQDNCNNGIDDDCDGFVDCFDYACCAAPACQQAPCGENGWRCCDGACVNTWGNRQHCGACGIECAGSRRCVRVPDGRGGFAPGAACRCALSGDQCGSFTCEAHDGENLCNCSNNIHCPGRTICVSQGGAHHSYCALP